MNRSLVVIAAGAVTAITGVALLSIPAAVIATGVLLVVAGLVAIDIDRKPPE